MLHLFIYEIDLTVVARFTTEKDTNTRTHATHSRVDHQYAIFNHFGVKLYWNSILCDAGPSCWGLRGAYVYEKRLTERYSYKLRMQIFHEIFDMST